MGARKRLITSMLVGGVAVSLVATSAPVDALAKTQLQPCDAGEFDAKLAANKLFVAWFYASWCPTCQRQRQALQSLADQRIKGSPFICEFDYDRSEALRKELGVKRQSTLVRYRRGKETSRSVGEKDAERLKRFLEGE